MGLRKTRNINLLYKPFMNISEKYRYNLVYFVSVGIRIPPDTPVDSA